MSFFKSIVVTGGAGFIGSNFVHYIFNRHKDCRITVLDALTYAGNLENLTSILDSDRVKFIKGTICDSKTVDAALEGSEIVFNFAAETHVDRSIAEAGTFIETDVFGTYTLLTRALDHDIKRFVQVSTDEVYGSSKGEHFHEASPLKPGNPYSASKCGGDLMCLAFQNTYGLPVIVTRSSNNFGPYQHVEKFIPLFTTNAIEGKELPLYGDGMHQRDWLYVEDNCSAFELIATKGVAGEVYNISSDESRPNLEVAEAILEHLGDSKSKIVFIEDRKGHDRVYAMDASKIKQLGWNPNRDFKDMLKETVEWYRDNRQWWERVKSGTFKSYYETHYRKKIEKGKTHGS